MITTNQFINYNFNKIILSILMIGTAIYLFSCGSAPLKELPDDNFMEEYMKEAEAKFKQDSTDKANEGFN